MAAGEVVKAHPPTSRAPSPLRRYADVVQTLALRDFLGRYRGNLMAESESLGLTETHLSITVVPGAFVGSDPFILINCVPFFPVKLF